MTEPSTGNELIELGIMAYHKSQFDKANELLDQALDIDKEAVEAMNYKGLLSLMHNDAENATQWWEKSLGVKENFDAMTHLAFQYNALGKAEKAKPLFEKALAFDESRSDLVIILAQYAQKEKNYSKAEALLKPYLKFEPADEKLWMVYAQVKLEKSESLSAIDVLKELLRKQPESSGATQLIAKIYWQLKDYAKAQEYYVKALEILPGHMDFLKEYGVLLRDHIDLDKSIDLFQESLQNDDLDFEMHYLLASSHEIKKDYESALKHYNRAFQLYPFAGQIKQKALQMEAALKTQ